MENIELRSEIIVYEITQQRTLKNFNATYKQILFIWDLIGGDPFSEIQTCNSQMKKRMSKIQASEIITNLKYGKSVIIK